MTSSRKASFLLLLVLLVSSFSPMFSLQGAQSEEPSSTDAPHSDSSTQTIEEGEAGLIPIPSLKVGPPRIKECFGHLECRVVQKHTCGDHTLFVGEVVATSADEDVMKGDVLDVLKAHPIVQKNHVYYSVCAK